MPPDAAGGASRSVLRNRGGVLADQRRRVAERDGRRVRVGSVGDDLQRDRLAIVQRRAVALRDRERDPRVAALQVRIDVADGRDTVSITVKFARRVEAGDEIAARRRAIAVGDDDRHVLHVGRRRVSEHRELDDRRDDDEAEEPRVLPQLEEFLPDQASEPLHQCRSRARRTDASVSIASA